MKTFNSLVCCLPYYNGMKTQEVWCLLGIMYGHGDNCKVYKLSWFRKKKYQNLQVLQTCDLLDFMISRCFEDQLVSFCCLCSMVGLLSLWNISRFDSLTCSACFWFILNFVSLIDTNRLVSDWCFTFFLFYVQDLFHLPTYYSVCHRNKYYFTETNDTGIKTIEEDICF